MVSHEDVVNGYRLILGREPEDESVIEYHCAHADLMALRRALLESEEFRFLQAQPDGKRSDHVTWSALDTPRVVFMHAPKTAGSSLHQVLRAQFPADSVCPERFNGLRHLSAGDLCRYRLFSGHFDLASAQLIPGPKRIVTLFREPLARLLSTYNFLRSHKPDIIARNGWDIAQLASTLDIEAFYAHPSVRRHPYFNNGMARMLAGSLCVDVWTCSGNTDGPLAAVDAQAAIDKLALLSAFGIQERFDESARHILTALGLPCPEQLPMEMAFDRLDEEAGNYQRVEPASVTPRLQERLDELTRIDRQLYGEVVRQMQQRLPAPTALDGA